jgi:hypothetical protein
MQTLRISHPNRVRYPARVKRRVAAVLPQGERYVQLFGAGEDLYRPDPMKDFSIHVHFTDSKGVSRQTTSRASVMEFLGYGGFDPPEYEIAKALNKIAEKLDGGHLEIATSRLRRLPKMNSVKSITNDESGSSKRSRPENPPAEPASK